MAACTGVNLYVADRSREMAELEREAEAHLGRALPWLDRRRGHHPWEADVRGREQLWVGGEPPSPALLEQPEGYRRAALRPRRGGIWTTSPVEGLRTPWLDMLGKTGTVWTLRVRDDARVYEVRSAEHWRQLVASYPRLAQTEPLELTPDVTLPAPLYLVDWAAAARDWDGVRFTMSGKLHTVSVPFRVVDGYTILDEEVGAEETFWLRWSF
ncbi:MAG TPA: hypothetical protein VGF23_03260, partial [Gaiellaceae bacterium]